MKRILSTQIQNPYWIVLLLSIVVFGFNAGELMLYGLDETKNAECAREMLQRNDWIVPTFNGELRTDKPPLHYYGMMIAYKVLGVNEFAARFFSLACGVITILFTYRFTQKYFNTRTAWIAATILLASVHVSIQFRMSVPDPYLIMLMSFSLMSFFYGYSQTHHSKSRNGFLLFYIGIGLSILSKGPVGMLLPGLIILFFLILKGDIHFSDRKLQLSILSKFHIIPGLLLVLLIALPWYIAVHIQTQGEWTEGFFLKHNLSRYTASMEGHGGIFLITILYVLVGLLPFSVFLPQSFLLAWKQRKNNDVLLFSLLVVSVITGFFMISSTKLPNYTVPAYPFAAILIAYFLDSVVSTRQYQKLKAGLIVYLILMFILPIGVYIALQQDASLKHLAWLAFLFLTFPLGAATAWVYYNRHNLLIAYHAVVISFLVTIGVLFGYAYPKVDKENPVAQTLRLLPNQQVVVGFKLFNPAYVYYLKRSIPVMHDPKELSLFLRQHPNAIVISREEFMNELTDIAHWKVLKKRRDTFESPTTVLLQKEQREITPEQLNLPQLTTNQGR
ncbi:glycosyltransferase family 39 protein [Xanthocytophaga agilis]|uniref:Glycosyltransferase family 39 protein n=1 Tax=Xanthocytophaga agilis TaxID=3048010 RepID=A0AAE3R9B2_9BACT|nr:glycosyltransferase family 39 protein [Xanthocytophaga agilis]MDJ1503078.1 glycosyltransferase family 39 protein [Xanthocytophaga agilis]